MPWFFYVFGKLAAVVGRNEPVLGIQGVTTILYTCVVPLFFAERGVQKVGGAKRLNPFLSLEQQATLEALPPLGWTLDSVIEGEIALAEIFIPRGRDLAAQLGAEWPEPLEAATVDYLSHQLGFEVGPFK